MKLIEWINGKTRLNEDTLKVFQENIRSAIEEQVEEFDFVMSDGVTKVDDGVNKGYYNKMTGQVMICFYCDVGQLFNSQHIDGFSVPAKYRPSKDVYAAGTTNGGFLLQMCMKASGILDLWCEAPVANARGVISYYVGGIYGE